jgi:hypothetical protein
MADVEKSKVVAEEERRSSEHLPIEPVHTGEEDNYHGMTLKILLVYLVSCSCSLFMYLLTSQALCLQYFVQLFNVVGSGAVSISIVPFSGSLTKSSSPEQLLLPSVAPIR